MTCGVDQERAVGDGYPVGSVGCLACLWRQRDGYPVFREATPNHPPPVPRGDRECFDYLGLTR